MSGQPAGSGGPQDNASGGTPSWAGFSVLAPGTILYIGPGGSAAAHAHHAIQLMWAVDGLLELELDDRTVTACSVLVPAGARHAVRSVTGRVVLALVEPHGPRGKALAQHWRGTSWPDALGTLDTATTPDASPDPAALMAWFDDELSRLGWRGQAPTLSRHVRQTLAFVDEHISGMPRLVEAAAAAHVSPSRLTHVFSEETGIPYRRYVLWARIKRAVGEVSSGANLTQAAVVAGFSDSAHMSRVFRANFGLPPSLLSARYGRLMDLYVRPTPLLDYRNPQLQSLLKQRGWCALDPSARIGAIYEFVRDEIDSGYNASDDISASEVLQDGLGQCNTKTTLLMALLRSAGIPTRFHGATIHKRLQRGVVTGVMYRLAPRNIVHSWAEVKIGDRWVGLEGVILDSKYLEGVRTWFPAEVGEFIGYGVGTENLSDPPIEWTGSDTYIQATGINNDLGVYDDPDAFYKEHGPNLTGVRRWLFRHQVRPIMNRRVAAVRKVGASTEDTATCVFGPTTSPR